MVDTISKPSIEFIDEEMNLLHNEPIQNIDSSIDLKEGGADNLMESGKLGPLQRHFAYRSPENQPHVNDILVSTEENKEKPNINLLKDQLIELNNLDNEIENRNLQRIILVLHQNLTRSTPFKGESENMTVNFTRKFDELAESNCEFSNVIHDLKSKVAMLEKQVSEANESQKYTQRKSNEAANRLLQKLEELEYSKDLEIIQLKKEVNESKREIDEKSQVLKEQLERIEMLDKTTTELNIRLDEKETKIRSLLTTIQAHNNFNLKSHENNLSLRVEIDELNEKSKNSILLLEKANEKLVSELNTKTSKLVKYQNIEKTTLILESQISKLINKLQNANAKLGTKKDRLKEYDLSRYHLLRLYDVDNLTHVQLTDTVKQILSLFSLKYESLRPFLNFVWLVLEPYEHFAEQVHELIYHHGMADCYKVTNNLNKVKVENVEDLKACLSRMIVRLRKQI